MHRSTSNFI